MISGVINIYDLQFTGNQKVFKLSTCLALTVVSSLSLALILLFVKLIRMSNNKSN